LINAYFCPICGGTGKVYTCEFVSSTKNIKINPKMICPVCLGSGDEEYRNDFEE
jgi:RecJ-like exonuclease